MKARRLDISSHEAVYELRDPDGFVAIHRSVDGRASGGTRVAMYASEEDGLADVLQLSKAMTDKCLFAELPSGGAKAVLFADRLSDRAEALEKYAAFVQTLGGAFFTAGDMGMTERDLTLLRLCCDYVAPDDLTPYAAAGVFAALSGALRVQFGSREVGNRAFAIQGVGGVGGHVARTLLGSGARVVAADPDSDRLEALPGVVVESTDRILAVDCDGLVPCAMGGVIASDTVGGLSTSILCGAANNLLVDDSVAARLDEAGVVYVPDFVASAGAAIHGVLASVGVGETDAEVARLEERVVDLLEAAKQAGHSPLAEARAGIERRMGG